jgi:hypothetical protein
VRQTISYVDYVGSSAESYAANLALPNNVTASQVVAPTVLVSFPLNDKYAGLSLTMPYSKVEVTNSGGTITRWGLNDPAIAFHKNLFGLKAYRPDEDVPRPRTFMSFHLTIVPPLGSYDRNAQLNTGANRWAFTPLVNLNIPIKEGVAWLEVYTWGRFFTNNNEFQGNKVLSQNALGMAGAWFSHNLGKKTWAAIGSYYDHGGETYIDGMRQNDAAHRFRPSAAINRRFGRFVASLRYESTRSKSNAVPWSGLILLRVGFPPLFNF